jgi:predicted nucleic acid-binding protein
MEKYRDQPMDMADAALVRVAEREGLRRVLTLDQSDFGVYRLARKGRFTLLPEGLR